MPTGQTSPSPADEAREVRPSVVASDEVVDRLRPPHKRR